MTSITASEATRVVRYTKPALTTPVLLKLYSDFGGLEAFASSKLEKDMRELRNAFLSRRNFPNEHYNELIAKSKTLNSKDLDEFDARLQDFASYGAFSKLWAINPSKVLRDLSGLETQLLIKSEEFKKKPWWTPLPSIHEAACKGDDPNNVLAHWGCETRRGIFDPSIFREVTLSYREQFIKQIEPAVLDEIYGKVFELTAWGRFVYAGSDLIHDDHWDRLASDKDRSVLNSIASHVLLPTHVAERIVRDHKTPSLRQAIAKNAVSKELLETIWHSTKSESIREVVRKNPLFK